MLLQQKNEEAGVSTGSLFHQALYQPVSEEEVKDIIAVWGEEERQKQAASHSSSLSEVALALDITEQEAARFHSLAQQRRATLRKVRRSRILSSVAALVTISSLPGFLIDRQLAGANHGRPAFEMVGSDVRPSELPGMTRVDMTMEYRPDSLRGLLFGPDWQTPSEWSYLTDARGNKVQYFPAPDGTQRSITQGLFRPMGGGRYTFGYEYPTAQVPKEGALSLTGFVSEGTRGEVATTVTIRR